MTDIRKAAQQALEFLSHDMVAEDWPHQKRKDAVCDALRAALAEPEQEPVAWEQFYPDIGKPQTTHWEGCEAVHPECRKPEPVALPCCGYANASAVKWNPHNQVVQCHNCGQIYTAPTPRKPLPEEEIVRLMVGEDRVQLLYAKPGDPYYSEFAEGAIRELVESGRAIERAHGIGEQT